VCETHEWRSAAGEVVRFVTRVGATSRFMPPVEIQSLRVPQAHGARFRGARHEPRLVLLPVVVPAPQTTTGRTELRRWAKALDPAKGEGTLTVVQGPSPGRFLNCVYEAGLETMAEDNGQPLELAVLGFRASDPYWLDASVAAGPVTVSDTEAAPDPLATTVITNTGDVNAWPVFTFNGPGSALSINNDTTGKVIEIGGAAFIAGDVVVVDTRPGRKTVTVNGANGFSRLSAVSTLWPLVPGANTVRVVVTGGSGATTTFTYNPRWLAP
jgi:hypothetical protein